MQLGGCDVGPTAVPPSGLVAPIIGPVPMFGPPPEPDDVIGPLCFPVLLPTVTLLPPTPTSVASPTKGPVVVVGVIQFGDPVQPHS